MLYVRADQILNSLKGDVMENEWEKLASAAEPEMQIANTPDKEVPNAARLSACSTPGVIDALGRLPEGAIITEAALATILQRHPMSIKRAVERGELPPAVRLLGRPVWLARTIVAYLNKRLDAAAQDAERERRRLERHRL